MQVPIDLTGMGAAIVNAIADAMPQLAADAVPVIQQSTPALVVGAATSVTSGGLDMLGALQNNPLNVLTSAPPALTYANAVVQHLQGVTLGMAIAVLALVVAWAGFQVMSNSVLGGLNFGEAFGRIIVGAAMLAGVSTGAGWVLDGTNRLARALLSADGGNLLQVFADTGDGGVGLVLTAIVEVAALWLYVVMWGRIVLLDVLLVFAPLAVTCWILPQTRSWFSLWIRLYVGWALVGPAVVLVLVLGSSLGSELGQGDASARLAAMVLSAAVFVVGAVKVPPMVVSGWGQAINSQAVVAAGSSLSRGGMAAAAALGKSATHKK